MGQGSLRRRTQFSGVEDDHKAASFLPLRRLAATPPFCIPRPIRRLALGLLGAIYAGAFAVSVALLSVLVGVAAVLLVVEEPALVREPLHFDYTQPHPIATAALGGVGGGAAAMRGRAVPSGHWVRASLTILLPESDHNIHVGVFQVTAEAISSRGTTIASSSQPCMLRFRSLPVRTARAFVLGVPLLIGMTSERQEIALEVLRYLERRNPGTKQVTVRLKPRAGTSDLPQIYRAEILLTSKLPWAKELIRCWKWTLSVWVSIYVYLLLFAILVFWFRPFVLPRGLADGHRLSAPADDEKERERFAQSEEGELSRRLLDTLKKWRSRRLAQLSEPAERTDSSSSTGEESEVLDSPAAAAAEEDSS